MNYIVCEVYKSLKKEGTYLYLQKPADLDLIPKELNRTIGELAFVMELKLDSRKKLAQEDVLAVMKNIDEQGFHLQIPPTLVSLLKPPGETR